MWEEYEYVLYVILWIWYWCDCNNKGGTRDDFCLWMTVWQGRQSRRGTNLIRRIESNADPCRSSTAWPKWHLDSAIPLIFACSFGLYLEKTFDSAHRLRRLVLPPSPQIVYHYVCEGRCLVVGWVGVVESCHLVSCLIRLQRHVLTVPPSVIIRNWSNCRTRSM